MKLKVNLIFIVLSIIFLFSFGTYANPLMVGDQSTFENILESENVEIVLTNNINFDNTYNSVTHDTNKIIISTQENRVYVLQGKDEDTLTSLIRRISGNLTLESIGSVFISNFKVEGETDSSSSGLGGAIYGEGNIILENFTGSFTENSAVGGASQGAYTNSTLSGIGGAIYSKKEVSLRNFQGNFTRNRVVGGNATGHEDNDPFSGANSSLSGLGGAIYGEGNIILENFTGNFTENSAVGGSGTDSGEVSSSGLGGAIYTWGNISIKDFKGNFTENSAIGGDVNGGFATSAGLGGAIYGTGNIILENFTGSFTGNSAVGGSAAGGFAFSSGVGGAIYGEGAIILENFKGSFTENSAVGGAKTNGGETHSSGRGGAIYMHTSANNLIFGGTFQRNSASTYSVGDMTSGLGGAIFFDARGESSELKLKASEKFLLKFIGNTHAPGGENNTTYNSIYFGTSEKNINPRINLLVEVEEKAYLIMLDPMASQQDEMKYLTSSVYSSIDLNINKIGGGTWILAGSNEMLSKTIWTISEGMLNLVEDLDRNVTHLNLSHPNSSFSLETYSLLLVSPTVSQNPHKITAENISILGKTLPGDSYINLEVDKEYDLLKLLSNNIIGTSQAPLEEGIIKGGAYDYEYVAQWKQEDLFSMVVKEKKYNPERGGEALLIASILTNPEVEFMLGENIWVKSGYTFKKYKDYKLNTILTKVEFNEKITSNTTFGNRVSFSTLTLEGMKTKIKADSLEIGFGLNFAVPSEINLNLILLGSGTNYNFEREIGSGSFMSLTAKLGIKLEKEIKISNNLSLIPNINYIWTYINTSHIEENGNDLYALYMDSHSETLNTVNALLDFRRYIKPDIYLQMGVGYIGNFGDTSPKTNAYFINDPDKNVFESFGSAVDIHLFKLNTKVQSKIGEKLNLNINYVFIKGKNTNEHKLELQINHIW